MEKEDIDSAFIDPIYNMDFENSEELQKNLPEIHIKIFLLANFVLTIMRSGIHQYYIYYPEYNWDLLLEGAKIIGGQNLANLIQSSNELFHAESTTDDEYNELQNKINPIEVYDKIIHYISDNQSKFKRFQ